MKNTTTSPTVRTNSTAFRRQHAPAQPTAQPRDKASVSNIATKQRNPRRSPDQMLGDCPTAEAQVAYILQRLIGNDRKVMSMLKDAHPSARASLRALRPEIDRLVDAVERQEQNESQQQAAPRLRTA